MSLTILEFTAFAWFISVWVGYSIFARISAKKTDTLSSVLYRFRKEWVQKLSRTGMSEVDAELLASLERQVSFFASTSLLILASLLTVLNTSTEAFLSLGSLPFVESTSIERIQLKLLLLIVVFVYAFFTFTWSIRQYGFCFILFGSSFHTVKYYKEASNYRATANDRNIAAMGKVLDRAAHSYNYGVRAYYFGVAALAWFISTPAFMCACAITVYTLYRREFKSTTLKALVSSRQVQLSNNDPKDDSSSSDSTAN